MREFKLFFIFVLVSFLASCGGEKKTSDNVQAAVEKAPVSNAAPVFPKLPNEYMLKMWNEGQMIDYVFHDLPFSMNQNEQASIRTNMTYISDEAVGSIPPGCKPMARQFYQVNGDIIFEADVYFDKTCQFYVFFVDGKAKYANKMADSGKQFFVQMIGQAMQSRENMQNKIK